MIGVSSTRALQLTQPSEAQRFLLVNESGGDTIYWSDSAAVSASSKEGEVAAGASTTLTLPKWVISAGHSVIQLIERDTEGAVSQAELEAKFAGNILKESSLPSSVVTDSRGSADGDILVHSGGSWARLAKGTTGQQVVIRSDGTLHYERTRRFTPELFGAKGDSTGSAGSGTDDSKPVQEAASAAAANGGEFFCERYYRTTKKIEAVTDTFLGNGVGTSRCGIVPDTSEYDAFVVGPGAEGSGTRPGGYVKNFDIAGGNCAVSTAGVAPVTGNAAFKLDGMRNYEVGIRVSGHHDIAFDSLHNCYFTTYRKAAVEEGAARVGINFRRGTENGEDQLVLDCSIKGEVAAIHITGGKNYRVIGGQLSASRATAAEEDERGVVILGKDYLGLAGAEDVGLTLETSFEYFQRCWTIRAFKQVTINAHSSFNAGATVAALGFYKNSAHASSYICLKHCSFLSSEFSKPAAEMVVREGSNSGSTWEETGSYGSYKDGTGETNALWNNMARRAEIPRAVGWRDGTIFYMQGMEFRVTSGVLEYSELHKESWSPLSPKKQEIASANTMTIETGVALVKVTGTTEIKKINPTVAGHRVTLIFTEALFVKNGENLKLASSVRAEAGLALTLVCDGANWEEVSRKASSAVEVASASTITIPGDARVVTITGTTEIKKINATYNGHIVVLRWASTAKLVAGENVKIAATLSPTEHDSCIFHCDGTNWYQSSTLQANP